MCNELMPTDSFIDHTENENLLTGAQKLATNPIHK